MKSIKTLFAITVLSGVLFTSCGIIKKKSRVVTHDYSIFPQGTILSGKMKDGRTLYLIREDSKKMAGVCFIDNDQAVVERMSFFADSSGATTIIFGNDTSLCKIAVHKSLKEIEITFPECPVIKIDSQTVRINYFGEVSQRVDYPERFKDPLFAAITPQKEIQYGTALGYYTSKPSDYISKDDYKKWLSEMLSISW
ncbi:MAG: hypothetical protein FWD56_03505, partial [Bacteroidales bacterium]|nr:hypothetical protein [Bacteroidales bacterium]